MYIYIHIHCLAAETTSCVLRPTTGCLFCMEDGSQDGSYKTQGKLLHTRFHKHKIHRKMPLTIHLRIPINIHWTSDNPLDNAIDNYNFFGKWH